MVNLETRPNGEASRSVHVQSSHARIMRVATLLVLAAAFVSVGAPTAAAAPTFTGDHVMSTLDFPPPCRGEKPGFCPDIPFVILLVQSSQL